MLVLENELKNPKPSIPAEMFLDLIYKIPIFQSLILKADESRDSASDKNMPTNSRNSVNVEEMRLDMCNIIYSLFTASLDEKIISTVIDFSSFPIQPVLAENISMLLDFCSDSQSFNELKLASLKTLLVISKKMALYPDRIAQFLPGTLSALVKLMLKKSTENHQILCYCFEIITLMLVGCLADSVCSHLFEEPTFLQSQRNAKIMPPALVSNDENHSELRRSRKWLADTSKNLELIFPRFSSFKTHPHRKVRANSTEMALEVFTKCTVSLKNCHNILIQTLLYVISDNQGDLSLGRKVILTLQDSRSLSSPQYSLSLEHSFLKLSKEFYNSMGRIDHVQETLVLFTNHLTVLGTRGQSCLEIHMPSIVNGLLKIISPELENIKLVQDTSSLKNVGGRMEGGRTVGYPKKEFKLMAGNEDGFEHVQNLVKQIMMLSGCGRAFYEQLSLVFDEYEYQAILLMNEVIRNTHNNDALVREILDRYKKLDVLSVAINQKDIDLRKPLLGLDSRNSGNSMGIHESNNTIIKINAVLEGLSIAAAVLSFEELNIVMMDSLYFMLEKLGDPNFTISNSAYTSLDIFAQILVPTMKETPDLFALQPVDSILGIPALIMGYVDYLVDSVSHKLRYVTLYPMASRVLVAAIRVVGFEIIGPLTTDLVDQVLDILETVGTSGYIIGIGMTNFERDTNDSFEGNREGIVGEMILVLQEICNAVKSGWKTDKKKLEGTRLQKEGLVGDEPMKKFILRLQGQKKQKERLENEALSPETFFKEYHEKGPENEKQAAEDSQEEGKKLPFALQTIEKILLKTQYFLASDSSRTRAKILMMLSTSLELFEPYQDALFPLIHKIWPLVLRKCRADPAPFVVKSGIQVIATICRVGGTFVRARVKNDLFDTLASCLEESLLKARKGAKQPNSRTNQIQKVAVAGSADFTRNESEIIFELLELVKEIVVYVPLEPNSCHRLVSALIGFLDASLLSRQTIDCTVLILRGAAVNRGVADYIWLLLAHVLGANPHDVISSSEALLINRKRMAESVSSLIPRGKAICYRGSIKSILDVLDPHSRQVLAKFLI